MQKYYEAASQDPLEMTRILGALGGTSSTEEVFTRAHINAFLGESKERIMDVGCSG